jgi:hypothetical protein
VGNGYYNKEEARRRAHENLRRLIDTPPAPKNEKAAPKAPSRVAKSKKSARADAVS